MLCSLQHAFCSVFFDRYLHIWATCFCFCSAVCFRRLFCFAAACFFLSSGVCSVYIAAYTLHAFSFLPLFVSHLPICNYYMWLYFGFAHMHDFCMIPDNKQLAFFLCLSPNLCVYSSRKNYVLSLHCLSVFLFVVQFGLKYIS